MYLKALGFAGWGAGGMGHINWPINIFLGMFGNVLLSDTHIDIF
jgi:hypothetical protein